MPRGRPRTEPTTVIRVPLALLATIQAMIDQHKSTR
jgi:hypothetical protein